MYFTYVLESLHDGKRYIGFTSNLRKRLDSHNKGYCKSTRLRKGFILIYYEACLDKNDAIHREKYLKTGFGRRYLKNRLRDYYSGN